MVDADPTNFWTLRARFDAVCEFPGCKYVETGVTDKEYATDLIQDHWLSCHGGKGAGALTGRVFRPRNPRDHRVLTVLGVSEKQTRKGYVSKSLMYDLGDASGYRTRIRAHVLKSGWREVFYDHDD